MAVTNNTVNAYGAEEREKIIVRTSIKGILANLALAAFKAFVGLASNSIAVVLDAVNNLSDALSSVITIIGTKLAGKAPDKEHPYGYGRIEYMSQLIVASIVLYAGITSFIESLKKVIHPETPEYSTISLVIIAAAIAVKLVLGAYVKKKGEQVNSGSLIASGKDASFDAILSASVLASAIIFIITGFSFEAFVGLLIALIIVKSGIEMISDALDEMLGKRAEGELSKKVKEIVRSVDGVRGAYDLFMNNYGPDKYIASLHVEVADEMTAPEIDRLTRKITEKVYDKTGIIIAAVGIYSANVADDFAGRTRAALVKKAMSHDGVLQIHGFYLDEINKTMSFDVIIDFNVENRREVLDEIKKEALELCPDYRITANLDVDVSD